MKKNKKVVITLKKYGAIEAGGTKVICKVLDENYKTYAEITVPTELPKETMPKLISFFQQHPVESIGVACFGPVDINPESKKYGYILNTPKIAWQQFDFLGTLKRALNIPMQLQTDVNVSALGELIAGKAKGKSSCVYVTIGTGIGGGYVSKDGFLPTLLHSEMGHIPMKRLPEDTFVGGCPFHKDCLEGLASGPALEKKAGKPAYELPIDDPIWNETAYYIAQALVTYTFTLSPEVIVLGGGVMKQQQLFPLIRESFLQQIAGYIELEELGVSVDEYIVYSGEENESAMLGALELALSTAK